MGESSCDPIEYRDGDRVGSIVEVSRDGRIITVLWPDGRQQTIDGSTKCAVIQRANGTRYIERRYDA